ncbi:MAG: hypothetical protein AAFQ57_10660 [Cyanobacteria bacterium J06626_14]
MKLLLGMPEQVAVTPVSIVLILSVGFVVAVSIGCYNFKGPLGWEDKERPAIVPEVEK